MNTGYDIHRYVSALNRLTLISMAKPTNVVENKLIKEINEILDRITPDASTPAAHLLDVEKHDDVRDICFDSLQFTYDVAAGEFKSNGADYKRLAELNAGTLKEISILHAQIDANPYGEYIQQELTEYIKYHGELGILCGFIAAGMQFLQWRKSTLYRREIYGENRRLGDVLKKCIKNNFKQLNDTFKTDFGKYLEQVEEFNKFNSKQLRLVQ